MNELFVTTKNYGDLVYDEIFLYYDGPCIFSLKNKLGYRFICLLESETQEFDRYIVAPVSVERYVKFVRNEWSIRHIFTFPEQGGVFAVEFRADGVNIKYDINIADIEKMNLPDDNEMLEYNGSYTTNEILLSSVDKNIPILQKSLEKNGEHRQFIYANELAKESSQFQKIFDGIANDEIRQLNNPSKNVIDEIKNACRVPIYGTYAASFGLQIEGVDFPKIGEEESGFTKYLKTYFELLNLSRDVSKDYLEKHKEALSGLKSYYRMLLSLGFDVKMTAATPKCEYFKLRMSRNDIIARYSYLSSITANDVEQLELVGNWAGVSFVSKKFQFQIKEGEIIKGRFDEDFEEFVYNSKNEIKILVEKKKEVGIVDDKLEKYTLLSIVSD